MNSTDYRRIRNERDRTAGQEAMKQVATVSALLTVGFSYPHIPNHRGG